MKKRLGPTKGTLVQELLGRTAHRKDEDDLSQRTQRTQRRIFFSFGGRCRQKKTGSALRALKTSDKNPRVLARTIRAHS